MDLIAATNPQYILVLAGDHVYKQDYSRMLAQHGSQVRSVVPGSESAYVYVIDEQNIARRRPVETGLRQNDFIEIEQGVEPGEQVAVLGLVKLRDGVPVSVDNQGLAVKRD